MADRQTLCRIATRGGCDDCAARITGLTDGRLGDQGLKSAGEGRGSLGLSGTVSGFEGLVVLVGDV